MGTTVLQRPARPVLNRVQQARIKATLAYIVIVTGGLVMMFPFFWLVTSALKDPTNIYILPPQWIPIPPQWNNFVTAVTVVPFGTFAINTAIITFGAMAGTLITASMAGYSFARLDWPGRNMVFMLLLSALMLPSVVTMVPTYIMYRYLGFLDTYAPLILPFWFGGGAFNIFLLRQFMMTIPMELEDAAKVDGASAQQCYLSIVLPLCKPALAIVAIFSFMHHWNDFLSPLIYLTTQSKYTLTLGLNFFKNQYVTQTELLMAGSTIMILPVIVVFFFAQRNFIQGIVLTGIKG